MLPSSTRALLVTLPSLISSNRVIKDFKDTDASHVEWAKAWVALFGELSEYVKKNHTTGLAWNPKGGDAPGLSVN